MAQPLRTFEDRPAVRERVPLLIGLVGPSGSGKTFSSLELATGIQRVSGGDVGVVDTEARRALHYADRFKFRHLPFAAPFGPLDYLAAIEHFVTKGVRTIVVDSMSHEHEGPGGVLEMHDAEVQRLVTQWRSTPDKVTMAAWHKPKSERRRLLNTLLQIECNFIFCFRAKEKLKLTPGQQPKALGWMPIAGEEFVYEMALNCLLYPGSGGVPSWQPDEIGEKAMVKLPEQFRAIFAERKPLSAGIGEQLARWAEGTATTDAKDGERKGLLTEIKGALRASYPDDTAAHKKARAEAVRKTFRITNTAEVEGMSRERLQDGLLALQRDLGGRTKEDEYAAEAAEREAAEAREEMARLSPGIRLVAGALCEDDLREPGAD